MYTAENKGFTIITNFGCDQDCDYCISKYHPLLQAGWHYHDYEDMIKWGDLEECIAKVNAPEVILSGGGDPFYRWWEHRCFYTNIHNLCLRYEKKLVVHTRIIPISDKKLLQLFSKIVLTVEYFDHIALSRLKFLVPILLELGIDIRVVQVVDKKMTLQDCYDYVSFLRDCKVKRITFREMYGSKAAQENFAELKSSYYHSTGETSDDGVMFLCDGDYHNYYFLADNKLYSSFFGQYKDSRSQE